MRIETDTQPGDRTELYEHASGDTPRRSLRWRGAAWLLIGTAVVVL